MKKSELNRERKRSDILDAARATFFDDGYIGAGMDEIARRAGVTKQTVYRYFSSKEALFRAALEARRDESFADRFDEALAHADPREGLTRFAEDFLELHLSEEHLAGVRLIIAEGPQAPEIARAFYALGPTETEDRLAGFFRERVRAGDPEYAAKVLMGALLSLRMTVLTGLSAVPTREEMADHAARTVAVCLEGAAAPPVRGPA